MTQGIELLELIYGQLHEGGIIRSKGEFSERLLGKSPSYLTSMRAKQRVISSQIIVGLGDTLLAEIDGLGLNPANAEICVLLRRTVAQINLYLADQLIPDGVAKEIGASQSSSTHLQAYSFRTCWWGRLSRWRRWMRSRGKPEVSS